MADEIAEKLNLFFGTPPVAEADFLSAPAPSSEEAQLCVDIAQTDSDVVVVATMAGTAPEKMELHLHNDLLTIRGERFSPIQATDYFHRENYWGRFSRSIVLPCDVRHELVRAEYKNGVLTVWLPKSVTGKSIPIEIIEE